MHLYEVPFCNIFCHTWFWGSNALSCIVKQTYAALRRKSEHLQPALSPAAWPRLPVFTSLFTVGVVLAVLALAEFFLQCITISHEWVWPKV